MDLLREIFLQTIAAATTTSLVIHANTERPVFTLLVKGAEDDPTSPTATITLREGGLDIMHLEFGGAGFTCPLKLGHAWSRPETCKMDAPAGTQVETVEHAGVMALLLAHMTAPRDN